MRRKPQPSSYSSFSWITIVSLFAVSMASFGMSIYSTNIFDQTFINEITNNILNNNTVFVDNFLTNYIYQIIHINDAINGTFVKTIFPGDSAVTIDDTNITFPILSVVANGTGNVVNISGINGITVDNTNIEMPIISTSAVLDIIAGTSIIINKTDPQRPVISLNTTDIPGLQSIQGSAGINVTQPTPGDYVITNRGPYNITGLFPITINNTDSQYPTISSLGLDQNIFQQTLKDTGIYGEPFLLTNISDGVGLYKSGLLNFFLPSQIVMLLESGSPGDVVTAITNGPVTGLTGLTPGALYYYNSSSSSITTEITSYIIGYALSSTSLYFDPENIYLNASIPPFWTDSGTFNITTSYSFTNGRESWDIGTDSAGNVYLIIPMYRGNVTINNITVDCPPGNVGCYAFVKSNPAGEWINIVGIYSGELYISYFSIGENDDIYITGGFFNNGDLGVPLVIQNYTIVGSCDGSCVFAVRLDPDFNVIWLSYDLNEENFAGYIIKERGDYVYLVYEDGGYGPITFMGCSYTTGSTFSANPVFQLDKATGLCNWVTPIFAGFTGIPFSYTLLAPLDIYFDEFDNIYMGIIATNLNVSIGSDFYPCIAPLSCFIVVSMDSSGNILQSFCNNTFRIEVFFYYGPTPEVFYQRPGFVRDSNGDFYFTVAAVVTANFGSLTPITISATTAIVVAKALSNGTWVDTYVPTTDATSYSFPGRMAADPDNNVYIPCSYYGNLTFDTISLYFPDIGNPNQIAPCLFKLTSNMDLVWAKTVDSYPPTPYSGIFGAWATDFNINTNSVYMVGMSNINLIFSEQTITPDPDLPLYYSPYWVSSKQYN